MSNLNQNPEENVIQLHGDEDPEYCKFLKKKFPNLSLWKAFRIKTKNDLAKIIFYENFIDAILLDSWNKETYGGSGVKIKIENLRGKRFLRPWWLAGGVSIDWLSEIIEDIQPYGIDISSSVEISPGIKDIKKISEIVKTAKGS